MEEDVDPIRVMIVDDHEIVRRGVVDVIDRDPQLAVVAEAGTVKEALRRAALVQPDVILVDLQLPDGTGIDVLKGLEERTPHTKPIVLTTFDDDVGVSEALSAGALAYILKTIRGAEINEVISAVASGRVLLDKKTLRRRKTDETDPLSALTPSEVRVLTLIGEGMSNRQIGDSLGIAEKTVKNHITSLLAKMGFQRRTQVAAWVASQRAAPWRTPS